MQHVSLNSTVPGQKQPAIMQQMRSYQFFSQYHPPHLQYQEIIYLQVAIMPIMTSWLSSTSQVQGKHIQ
jgi:hypothetical protein